MVDGHTQILNRCNIKTDTASCFLSAGDSGEELHSKLFEERLAERTFQPRELSGGAERQEDDDAGRRDLGRDPAGRAGQMTDVLPHLGFYLKHL